MRSFLASLNSKHILLTMLSIVLAYVLAKVSCQECRLQIESTCCLFEQKNCTCLMPMKQLCDCTVGQTEQDNVLQGNLNQPNIKNLNNLVFSKDQEVINHRFFIELFNSSMLLSAKQLNYNHCLKPDKIYLLNRALLI